MRNLIKHLCVFLLTITIIMSIVPMAQAGKPIDDDTYLRTSDSDSNYLELSIDGDKLTVSGIIIMDGLTDVLVQLDGDRNDSFMSRVAGTSSGKKFSITRSISSVNKPTAVSIYLKSKNEDTYWSYSWNRIYIEKDGSSWHFLTSPVLENNEVFLAEWVDVEDFLSDDISPEIKKQSDKIVGNVKDDYQKLFLLNKWVAENIYYDYDSYYGKSETTYSSEEILISKRSVCEGYANILRDLIRAQGIPAMKTSTFALGVGNDGSFAVKEDQAATVSSNHAHVEAYVGGRWITMDPTWDSNNKYENGLYNKKAPTGYYYFDISPEAFALDHKIIRRGDNTIRMEDGVIFNRNLWKDYTLPSDWAIDEVSMAIKAGLVPNELRGNFTNGISRGNLAKMLVCLLSSVYGKEAVSGGKIFTDTTDSNVLYAADLDIIKGYEQNDGTYMFKPDNTLKRAEMAAILNRVAKLCGEEVGGYDNDITFDDTVTHWCKKELGWPVHFEVVKGTTAATFLPESTLTVEQAITMIYRTYEILK